MRLNRAERRKKAKDPIWLKYKKPTSRRIFYKTFQKDGLSAGIPPDVLFDKKGLRDEVRDFLMNFKQFESYDLDYLEEKVLPIRYCLILPRNYATLLFALYVNAIAMENKKSFIDCYRNIALVNERFQKPPHKLQDIYLTNQELQSRFLEIFRGEISFWTMNWTVKKVKPTGIFYLVNAELESPEVSRRFNVTLLLDFETFVDPKNEFHAFLDFSAWKRPEIQEGIVFFENKKNITQDQKVQIYYITAEGAVKSEILHWNPHAHIVSEKMQKIQPNLQKIKEKAILLTPTDAMKLIERRKPKILNKTEHNKFKDSLKMQNIKKSANDLTKNYELNFPRAEIPIFNYFLSLNIAGTPIRRFYPLNTSAYVVVKRHLFLYKLVGPFRDILGLPKRTIRKTPRNYATASQVQFITPPVCEEIPVATREMLKNYATPSQVLFKVVDKVKETQGDVESTLKYIRGLYRASRKISLMLKKKEFELIPKVVARYL
jgi:hypothetical protein